MLYGDADAGACADLSLQSWRTTDGVLSGIREEPLY
jgi:hypothetical protein